MNGNGLAGIIVSISRIITKVSVPATEEGNKKSLLLLWVYDVR